MLDFNSDDDSDSSDSNLSEAAEEAVKTDAGDPAAEHAAPVAADMVESGPNPPGVELVGARVRLYYVHDDAWYGGLVISHSTRRGHQILLDPIEGESDVRSFFNLATPGDRMPSESSNAVHGASAEGSDEDEEDDTDDDDNG